MVNFRNKYVLSLQVERGNTGNPTVKQVPEYRDYSASASCAKKSTLTRSSRRGSNVKTERLREEDLEVKPDVAE